MRLREIPDQRVELAWLRRPDRDGEVTGFDADPYPDSTWVLHAFTVGEGGPRVRWGDHLDLRARLAEPGPPSFHWLDGLPPEAVGASGEGCLDAWSFDGLVEALAAVTGGGLAAECFVYYASMAALDGAYLGGRLYRGPLADIGEVWEGRGGPCELTPSNVWPVDRGWLLYTDYDLDGTRVSGPRSVVDAVRAHPALETIDWRPPAGF